MTFYLKPTGGDRLFDVVDPSGEYVGVIAASGEDEWAVYELTATGYPRERRTTTTKGLRDALDALTQVLENEGRAGA